jgi:RNA polymerase sigma-70 factor (ECF subfamily)
METLAAIPGVLAAPSRRPSTMSDAPGTDPVEALVRRAQAGDASSFAGLYERFHDKIFRYVYFKTGNPNDAEDITEDVFLRMLESINSFRWKGHPFSSWLFRIAHNLIVDHFRKRSRQKNTPLDDAGELAGASSHDLEADLDIKLSVERVQFAMEGLTDLQKEVMSLRFAAGLSVRETAEAVGKRENAVKALQHAAIKKLRVLLGARTDGPQDRVVPNWSPE